MAESNEDRVLNYGRPPTGRRTVWQFIGGIISGVLLTQLAVCAGIFSATTIRYWAIPVGGAGVVGVAIWGIKLRRLPGSAYGAGVLIGLGVNALLWGWCYLANR